MDEKITRLLGSLNYDELLRIKRDLSSGALYMQHLVNKKIYEAETSDRTICASCGADLNNNRTNPYTMIFGQETIKKKASFCGIDCMEEFLRSLRNDKMNVIKRQLD